MHLTEKDFLGRTLFGLPLPDSPFDGAPPLLPVLIGIGAFQPLHERLRLQRRFPLKQFFELRPDIGQRVDARPPRVRNMRLARQFAAVAVLACGFAIHACLHRCSLQRRLL